MSIRKWNDHGWKNGMEIGQNDWGQQHELYYGPAVNHEYACVQQNGNNSITGPRQCKFLTHYTTYGKRFILTATILDWMESPSFSKKHPLFINFKKTLTLSAVVTGGGGSVLLLLVTWLSGVKVTRNNKYYILNLFQWIFFFLWLREKKTDFWFYIWVG